MAPITSAIVGLAAMAASGYLPRAQELSHRAPCSVELPASVRIMDCRLATCLSNALPRSATLRGLTDRIDGLHGLVYITTAVAIRSRNNHRLLGLTWNTLVAAGSHWIARVEIERRYDDEAIALLAHELHHVIELLEPTDGRRDGSQITEGVLETNEAQDVQRRVRRELGSARR